MRQRSEPSCRQWTAALVCAVALGGCQSDPSPLPPPPIASYGHDGWDPDDAAPSYGGVGAADIITPRDITPGDITPGDPAPPVSRDVPESLALGDGAPLPPPDGLGDAATGGMRATPEPGFPDTTDAPVAASTYVSRPFRWHASLSDAQADAREQGKLILALATRPGCGLCEQFKNRTAVAVQNELQQVAVGYAYDASPRGPIDARSMYRFAQRKLPRATLMPLVGFVTPDVTWVHGFFGARTMAQFVDDIALVRSSVPSLQRSRMPAPDGFDEGAPMAQAPPDAGGLPMSPPPPGYDTSTGVVDTLPSPGIDDTDHAAVGGMTGGTDTLPDVPPAADAPTEPVRSVPVSGTSPSHPWMPDAPPIAPVRASSSSDTSVLPPTLAAEAGPWGQERFRTAMSHMRGKRYGAAQSVLSDIMLRFPGTAVEREANKGTIAIYNAKRIDKAATAAERSQYEQRARQDLKGTIWRGLFDPAASR